MADDSDSRSVADRERQFWDLLQRLDERLVRYAEFLLGPKYRTRAEQCIEKMFEHLLKGVRAGTIEPGEGLLFAELRNQCKTGLRAAMREGARNVKYVTQVEPSRQPQRPDKIVEQRELIRRVHDIARGLLAQQWGEPDSTLVIASMGLFGQIPMDYQAIMITYRPLLEQHGLTEVVTIRSRVHRCLRGRGANQGFLALFADELRRQRPPLQWEEWRLVFEPDEANDDAA